MSFERIAKDNIKSLYPEAYAEGSFAKRVIGSYTMNFDERGMIIQDSWNLGLVPDCYFHFWFPNDDQDGGVDYFIVCEVEDTNPLTKYKLSIYGQLWDHMHNNLSVWSFNRYGQFTTSHNLLYWYFHGFLNIPVPEGAVSIIPEWREPLFPDNKNFFEAYGDRSAIESGFHEKYEPWSEERRLRVFRNTKNVKERYRDYEEARKYRDKYGIVPLTFAKKYPEDCFWAEKGPDFV
jgi:hypothetical protein